jgi:hypothetical protein
VARAKLRVSAYDRDLVGNNQNIGEAVIPITELCHELMRTVQRSPEVGRCRLNPVEACVESAWCLQSSLDANKI